MLCSVTKKSTFLPLKHTNVLNNFFFWMPRSEISNEYSKRWVGSNHIHNFRYFYNIIFIKLIFKDEYFIVLILKNTHDVDFDSPLLNFYKNHKISMIRVRTLQYSVKSCVFFFAVNYDNNSNHSNHLKVFFFNLWI